MPGVYISYPFCMQKCSFCNFASSVSAEDLKLRYERMLLEEVRTHAWEWLPETLYIGGGTPSLAASAFFNGLLAHLPTQRVIEFTIECAPGTITPERIDSWQACGVNRVSLGVQSFVLNELRRTGRRHTPEIAASEIALLRKSGIPNINIDLIAGLPGQTSESWRTSLDWIEHLRPPHVSVYILEIDEDSRLGKEAILNGSRYSAALLPDDDLTASFYEEAVERLGRLGIHRYEISNFALAGFESRHNLKYWQLEPYIGFGLDAHSFDGRYRWGNPDSLPAYLAAGEQGLASITREEAHLEEEKFFVGLRLATGIRPSPREWLRFAGPIARWTDLGLLQQDAGKLWLSGKGMLMSNEILQEFVNG